MVEFLRVEILGSKLFGSNVYGQKLTIVQKEQMSHLISNPRVFVFDVRDQNEVDGGHIDAANINHIPLDEIDEALMLRKRDDI